MKIFCSIKNLILEKKEKKMNYCYLNTNSIIYKEIKENAEFYGLDISIFDNEKYFIDSNIKIDAKSIDTAKYIIENYGNTKKFIEGEAKVYVSIDSPEFFFFYFFSSHLFSYSKSNFGNSKNYIGDRFITTKKIYEKMKDGLHKNLYKEFSKDIYRSIMNNYKNNAFVMKNSIYHNEYIGNNNIIRNLSQFDCPEPLAIIPRTYIKKVDDNKIDYKKLSNNAIEPKKGTNDAAGYDLHAAYDSIIKSRSRGLIKTDISIQIPNKYYGRIAPRSGLTLKYGIDVGAGVIDSDYRGNIGVILFNHSDNDFIIKKGDKIAQLILERIWNPILIEVDELEDTKRGEDGFGSTDQNKILKK